MKKLKLVNFIPNHPPGEMLSSVLFSFGIALRPGDQQKEEGEGDAVARHIVNVGVDPAEAEEEEEATPFSCPDGAYPLCLLEACPPSLPVPCRCRRPRCPGRTAAFLYSCGSVAVGIMSQASIL